MGRLFYFRVLRQWDLLTQVVICKIKICLKNSL